MYDIHYVKVYKFADWKTIFEEVKRAGDIALLKKDRYIPCREHVEVSVAIAWAGMPIEPTCFSACASQTSWLLDFFDYFSAFFICRRVGPARWSSSPRDKERKRKKKRDRDMMFGAWEERFVVLENRILIAWMPSKILVDRTTAAPKENERRCMIIDPNMRRT